MRALESTERAMEPAGRALLYAGSQNWLGGPWSHLEEPAERPSRGNGDSETGKHRRNRAFLIPQVIVPYEAAAQKG